MAGAESEMPAVRRVGNIIFANLVSLISAEHITDSASGMRVFKKSILERIYPLPDGLNLTPVMSTRALHEQLKMIEVPIPYSERVGRSKLNVVRDGVRFAQSIVWTALTYNPVRLLGIAGLAAFGDRGAHWRSLFWRPVSAASPRSAPGASSPSSPWLCWQWRVSASSSWARCSTTWCRSSTSGRSARACSAEPIFETPLDRHFWWMGLLAFVGGLVLALMTLVLGLNGWPTSPSVVLAADGRHEFARRPPAADRLVHHAGTGGAEPARRSCRQ